MSRLEPGARLPASFESATSPSVACDALLMDVIRRLRGELARPIAVGLCGPQGSGKSTMAARLALALTRDGCPTAVLALDDFYLRRGERIELSRAVHPLLLTRGVPGTHDLGLLRASLAGMLAGNARAPIMLPVFDKARDDRAAESEWTRVQRPIEVVIVEGWCVGARPQSPGDLVQPLNDLEREEDRDGRWRHYVNDQLAGGYGNLFARLDLRLLLRAPSFEVIQDWRAEQEAGLDRSSRDALAPMDAHVLRRFISHFERLTRWMHRDEPADLVIELDDGRIPRQCRVGRGHSHMGNAL